MDTWRLHVRPLFNICFEARCFSWHLFLGCVSLIRNLDYAVHGTWRSAFAFFFLPKGSAISLPATSSTSLDWWAEWLVPLIARFTVGSWLDEILHMKCSRSLRVGLVLAMAALQVQRWASLDRVSRPLSMARRPSSIFSTENVHICST